MVKLPKGVSADNVQSGMFGLIRYNRTTWGLKPAYMEWYYCRDSFQYAWRKDNKHPWIGDSFFFVCNHKKIAAFLKCAEKQLGLWRKTKVSATDWRGICNIRPAPFWLEDELRMSLFTILLRAAETYRIGSDWKDCLYSHPYAQETREAIEYFFSGHVVYRRHRKPNGWCYAFSPMYEREKYDKLLRRPIKRVVGDWMKRLVGL